MAQPRFCFVLSRLPLRPQFFITSQTFSLQPSMLSPLPFKTCITIIVIGPPLPRFGGHRTAVSNRSASTWLRRADLVWIRFVSVAQYRTLHYTVLCTLQSGSSTVRGVRGRSNSSPLHGDGPGCPATGCSIQFSWHQTTTKRRKGTTPSSPPRRQNTLLQYSTYPPFPRPSPVSHIQYSLSLVPLALGRTIYSLRPRFRAYSTVLELVQIPPGPY